MTEKKKPTRGSRAKSPVYVSELMKKQPAPRGSRKRAPAEEPPSPPPTGTDGPDVYQFVSDGYQSLTRTVSEFRSAFKKDPVLALQDLQIRAVAFLAKKLPTRKANVGDKPNYRRMRREWIKRRVMQSKPARALKNRLKKN